MNNDLNIQYTLALIKPDAVSAGFSGPIIDLIEKSGFEILALEKRLLSQEEAEGFYAVHKARPFFRELVTFMTSGPIIALVLVAPNAVNAWREVMGATNPAEARIGSIRQMFGKNVGENATHGSDSVETAEKEIAFLFECCDDEEC